MITDPGISQLTQACPAFTFCGILQTSSGSLSLMSAYQGSNGPSNAVQAQSCTLPANIHQWVSRRDKRLRTTAARPPLRQPPMFGLAMSLLTCMRCVEDCGNTILSPNPGKSHPTQAYFFSLITTSFPVCNGFGTWATTASRIYRLFVPQRVSRRGGRIHPDLARIRPRRTILLRMMMSQSTPES